MIRDTSTGQCYDIRTQNATIMLNEVDKQLTKLPDKEANKPWEEWWKKKRRQNFLFLTAAETGDKEKVLELLDANKHGDLIADINTKGLDEFTPLHLATSEGRIDVIICLLEHGAMLEALTSSMRTPLHVACNRGNKEIIEILVNKGANINAQDKDGNTPSHILSEAGWIESLSWLLKMNPDLTIKNNYGETAIEVAETLEVRQAFLRYVNPPAKEGDYSRTIMENVMFHNNRIDTVKSYLFKAQLAAQMQSPANSQPNITPPEQTMKQPAIPESKQQGTTQQTKPEDSKRRLIKIIEASKKLQGMPEKPKPVQKLEVGPEDFEPLHVLGKGSFGEVYLVRYKETGKEYAMKVLNKRRVLAQNLVKYARTERNVLCYTKHQFIVGLDFAFQTSTKLFMLMDYCPG